MMSTRLRIILFVAFLIILLWILRQVQKRRLDLRYTLSWLLLNVVLIFLVLFPGILSGMARFFGIYSPVNMIFFCGFGFSLIIIYTLTAAVSKLAEEVKRLAQKIALLEKEKEEEREGTTG